MILLCLPGHLDEQVVRGLAAFGEESQIARRCADIAEVLAAVEANLGRVVLLWEMTHLSICRSSRGYRRRA